MKAIPLTEEQRYLLVQMNSECCEVAHIITKALQFGLEEICPEKFKSNAARTNEEIVDLIATHQLLVERGVLPAISNKALCEGLAAKKLKIQRYMDYALSGAPHPREATPSPASVWWGLREQFEATVALAESGDMDAIERLSDLSVKLLAASRVEPITINESSR